jgi:hypothetical protein
MESNTPFIVLSISREMLLSLGFTKEKVTALTDGDMEFIAHALQKGYVGTFEERVQFAASVYLIEKDYTNG